MDFAVAVVILLTRSQRFQKPIGLHQKILAYSNATGKDSLEINGILQKTIIKTALNTETDLFLQRCDIGLWRKTNPLFKYL